MIHSYFGKSEGSGYVTGDIMVSPLITEIPGILKLWKLSEVSEESINMAKIVGSYLNVFVWAAFKYKKDTKAEKQILDWHQYCWRQSPSCSFIDFVLLWREKQPKHKTHRIEEEEGSISKSRARTLLGNSSILHSPQYQNYVVYHLLPAITAYAIIQGKFI